MRAANGAAESGAEIAEIARFALIDIFGDAAGKHHAVDAAELRDRVGEIKMRDVVRQRPRRHGGNERIGHAVGDFLQVGGRGGIAAVPGKAGALGVMLAGRIEADDLAVLDHLQAAADMHRGGGDHLAVLDQAELGGAAADVDIENALAFVARHPRRAGAVGRQHRLHVMAGGGGDEFAALLGQDLGNALRVVAPQRFAGENDDAGIDLVRRETGRDISVVDDGAELGDRRCAPRSDTASARPATETRSRARRRNSGWSDPPPGGANERARK